MSINISRTLMTQLFQKADTNGDKQLSRQEILAQAERSYNTSQSRSRDRLDAQKEFQVLGLFLQDSPGPSLFNPDQVRNSRSNPRAAGNQDGLISFGEMMQLLNAGGDHNHLTANDFNTYFGTVTKPTPFSEASLQSINIQQIRDELGASNSTRPPYGGRDLDYTPPSNSNHRRQFNHRERDPQPLPTSVTLTRSISL